MTYFAIAHNQLTDNSPKKNMSGSVSVTRLSQSLRLSQPVKVCQLFAVTMILSLVMVGCSDKPSKESATDEQSQLTENSSSHEPVKIVSTIVLASNDKSERKSGNSHKNAQKPIVRTLSGQVVSAKTSNISFDSTGKIMVIYANMGSHVSKGEVIAEIDNTNYQLQLSQTKSQVSQAKSQVSQAKSKINQTESQLSQANDQRNKAKIDVKRYEELIPLGAVSQTEVDSVRFALRAAEDQVHVAENQVEVAKNQGEVATEQVNVAKASLNLVKKQNIDTRLTAPFSGVIVQQLGEVGQIVSPSVPVFTLATDHNKEVRVTVPENLMMSVGLGQPMLVNFPAIGLQARGKVTEVSSQANFGSFPVTVRLINLSPQSSVAIRSGMTAEVAFQLNQPQTHTAVKVGKEKGGKETASLNDVSLSFSVPPSAVGASSDNYVYRINKINKLGEPSQTSLEKVSVVISDMSGDSLNIRATGVNGNDLQIGDKIVRTGVSLLQEGQTVELMGSGSKRVNP